MSQVRSRRKNENTAVQRLKKDYLRLCQDPVPYVTAVPDPRNILEWHYCLQGLFFLSNSFMVLHRFQPKQLLDRDSLNWFPLSFDRRPAGHSICNRLLSRSGQISSRISIPRYCHQLAAKIFPEHQNRKICCDD